MKFFYKIKQIVSNSFLLLRSVVIPTPEQIQHKVPYVCQFASPGWAEMILKDDQPIIRDPLWADSGAATLKEYEQWVLHVCGTACTAMALQFYNKGVFRPIPLALDASKSGVYEVTDTSISEMKYLPYSKWIKRFGLKATMYNKLTFKSIRTLLASGSLVLASVNPNIKDYNTAPKTQIGGHFVLITGYNKKEKTITIHNPAGFENNQTQINHTLQLQVFTVYFAGRGISIKNKTKQP